MQPELKAAGFDMKIKNTSADNLFGKHAPGRQLPDWRSTASELTGAHAGPVLDVLHARTSRRRRTSNTGNNWQLRTASRGRHAARARRQQPRRQRAPGRRPRRPTTSSPTTTSRCRSTRCPTSSSGATRWSVRSRTTRSRACSGTSISGASSSSVDADGTRSIVMSSPIRAEVDAVLRYLVRRVLGSIPVLLVASFITFWLVRLAVDPLAKFRHAARTRRCVIAAAAQGARPRPSDRRAVVGLAHAVRARRPRHEQPHAGSGVGDDRPRAVADAAAAVLGDDLLGGRRARARRVLRGEAVLGRRLRVHRAVVPRHRDARRSGSRCSPSALLVTVPEVVVPPERARSSIRSGCTAEGVKGFNLDYFRHLALPVLALTVHERRARGAGSSARRCSRCSTADYVRTARAKGVPQRQVIFKHALRNALIPFVTVDRARHRRSSSAA